MAAEYSDGLVEAWAHELSSHLDDTRPVSAPLGETEAPFRVRRHCLRGPDPDTAREVRDREIKNVAQACETRTCARGTENGRN